MPLLLCSSVDDDFVHMPVLDVGLSSICTAVELLRSSRGLGPQLDDVERRRDDILTRIG